MSFRFKSLDIPDVVLVEAKSYDDHRGFFMETYKSSEFVSAGISDNFVQDNFSRSRRSVFRGLHYQNPPRAQGKLVRVYRGEIVDVAVDIRAGSPTYARFVTAKLTDRNGLMLWVPPGFAHGFCAVSDEADVAYKVTQEYDPDVDRGIRWDDPEIALEIPVKDPILSDKDRALPHLRDADNHFVYQK
jgi:dTDP-4-dehydrorhamnose 3,5-epimerase